MTTRHTAISIAPRLGVTLCTLAIALLTGCQQERNTNAPVSSVRDVPPATAAAATTAEPASVPKSDPSLPAATTSAAVSPPAAAPATAGAATATPSDSSHTALTPAERTNTLPLEGQTNSYSSDAFAKRGNDDVPRPTADSARGNESVSTPNVYPKVSK